MKLKPIAKAVVKDVRFWIVVACCMGAVVFRQPWAIPFLVALAALWSGYEKAKRTPIS